MAAELTIDADAQYSYAEGLFRDGYDERAAGEYDRFLHFFPDDSRTDKARFQMGMCYFNLNRFSRAEAVFNQVLLHAAASGTRHPRARLMLVECRRKQNDLGGAAALLRSLIGDKDEAGVQDEARYRLGWILVEAAAWRDAQAAFGSIRPEHKSHYAITPVLSKLTTASDIPRKIPELAGFLSILPGAGHLYCARPRDAAIAFLLNAALIGATWEAFDQDLSWLGSGMLLVTTGVYSGTLYSAVNSAHKYNRHQQLEFIKDIKRLRSPNLSYKIAPDGLQVAVRWTF